MTWLTENAALVFIVVPLWFLFCNWNRHQPVLPLVDLTIRVLKG